MVDQALPVFRGFAFAGCDVDLFFEEGTRGSDDPADSTEQLFVAGRRAARSAREVLVRH